MKKPLIAALAAATVLAAGAAHAGGNVQWSVGVNLPNVATVISNFPFPPIPTVVIQQAPVYAPPPVVYQPEPRVVYQPEPRVVYQRPVVVYQEPVVVYQPVPVSYGRHWDRHDRYDNRQHGPYGDRDHDGIPNRYDRVDNRQYADRDHDGVPNRYDPRDDRKYRH